MRQKQLITIAAVAALFAVTGCQTTRNNPERQADMARDIKIAEASFTDADTEACIADFKAYMNDPSSFELVAPLAINHTWMDVTYGQTWDYLPPRRVVYTAPVRGKNKFGGLVLNEMRCIYGVTDNEITFAAAKSR